MLNAAVTQFKLGDDGVIRFQSNPTNPLPGEPVARVRKGAKILEPDFDLIESGLPAGVDNAAAKSSVQEWLKTHVRLVLEPVVALEQAESLAAPVRGIFFQMYEALGIVPREQIEDLIGTLDPEMRQVLRAKQVKLGPVLVFLPALNKPAGVRLRGLLWALWNDKKLPAELPKDGIVSFKVSENVDRDFHRAIGYPVYGPRAIRIDMLDRVINAVYDSAKDGKFQAQHKMAEWLGCQIDDLYQVLTAMGHRKIHDPLDQKKEEPKAEEAAPVSATEEKPAEVAAPQPQVKPELATFALKKGKAFEKPVVREKSEYKPKSDKKFSGKRKDQKEERPERPKMIQSGPKPKLEDSPFAILEQLKVRKDVS